MQTLLKKINKEWKLIEKMKNIHGSDPRREIRWVGVGVQK